MSGGSLTLKGELCKLTPFQRIQYGKGGKEQLYSEETWQIINETSDKTQLRVIVQNS